MEKQRKYTYVEFIKRMNEIFPATTDFDYRTTNAIEIGKKVKELLIDMGYFEGNYLSRENYEDYEMAQLEEIAPDSIKTSEDLENFLEFKFDNINPFSYYFIKMINKETEANQNDALIKYAIIKMKNNVLRRDYMETYFEDCGLGFSSDILNGYTEIYGSVEELEEFTKYENIKNYITKLMTIKDYSKYKDNDVFILKNGQSFRYYDGNNKFVRDIVYDILFQYGFEENTNKYHQDWPDIDHFQELRDEITDYLNKLVEFEKTNPSDEQLNAFVEENTTGMVDFIADYTKIALTNRRRQEKKKNKEKSITSSITENQTDKNIDSIEGKIDDNFNEMVDKYNKVIELIEKQKEIFSQLQELETKKKQLESEFVKNDIEIKKGGSNGI